MPTVTFVNEKKQIQVPEGANLRQEAIKAGINLYDGMNGFGAKLNQLFNCHGLGHCGTCRVLVTKGREKAGRKKTLGLLDIESLRMKFSFARIGHEDTMRLACRVLVEGDLEVVTRPQLNLCGDNFFS